MSFTAIVEDDTIKLPAGMHLPNGTKVQIEPERETAPVSSPLKGDTFAERFAEFIGCIDSGVPDRADNHDHYLYGTAKRTP